MSHPNFSVPLLIALFILGCSSVSETPDKDLDKSSAGYGAAEAYEAAAQWLPSNTQVVVAATSTNFWDLLGNDLLAISPAEEKPGAVGTTSGLRVDLEDHVYEYFGFDPGLVDGLVFAASEDSAALIVFGAFQEFDHEGEFEVAGRRAFEVAIPEALYFGLMQGMGSETAVVLPIEEPRRGLVVTTHRSRLKTMIEATDATPSPEDTGRRALYSQLFMEATEASIAIASTSAELGDILGFGPSMPIPKTAVLTYDGNLSATFSGDDLVLAELQKMIQIGMGRLQTGSAERYGQSELSFEERTLAIYSHHIIEALSRQIQPEVSDGRLRYDVHASGSEFGLLINYAVVHGMFLFVDALEDAMIRTAQMEVNQLRRIVETYYLTTTPNQLPDELEDLTRGNTPMTKEIPLDPWGNEYIYKKVADNEFEVFSSGPDGVAGTSDDIHTSW